MKSFDKLIIAAVALAALLIAGANALFFFSAAGSGKPYLVEISRLSSAFERGEEPDISACEYVNAVEKCDENAVPDDFFDVSGAYAVRKIGVSLYRFDYSVALPDGAARLLMNAALATFAALTLITLLYLRARIIKPFGKLCNVPYELSKGNLAPEIPENRGKYFGKFVWGVNVLRENLEKQKERELALQKEKQTLILSVSHDIKTPLSAIKLYSGALSSGLYSEPEKQRETALAINAKADEIESFVSELIASSGGDFLPLDVTVTEFYFSDVIKSLTAYYKEKLSLAGTVFSCGKYADCILKGDRDRTLESLQNVMENAVKYGDGREISLSFSDEEDCRLATVKNTGCTLPEAELPHIFECFWRGSNSSGKPGSGLGLYICRRLMQKTDGDIFAAVSDGEMSVTIVLRKA